MIYVASKGRADKCPTITNLFEARADFTVVVEPQDVKAYSKLNVHNTMVLGKNNQGIAYARNSILERARFEKQPWIWMLDDDISQTYLVHNGKNVKTPINIVLKTAQLALCDVEGLAIGALEYGQYSWAAKKPLAMNSYCDVAVLINVRRTAHLSYRDGCKEDRDFVLQCLASGYQSARSTRTSFQVPKNGSNKGGLHDAYASGLENHWSKKMVELWPGVCQLHTKKDGRPDVKVNWKLMKTRP